MQNPVIVKYVKNGTEQEIILSQNNELLKKIMEGQYDDSKSKKVLSQAKVQLTNELVNKKLKPQTEKAVLTRIGKIKKLNNLKPLIEEISNKKIKSIKQFDSDIKEVKKEENIIKKFSTVQFTINVFFDEKEYQKNVSSKKNYGTNNIMNYNGTQYRQLYNKFVEVGLTKNIHNVNTYLKNKYVTGGDILSFISKLVDFTGDNETSSFILQMMSVVPYLLLVVSDIKFNNNLTNSSKKSIGQIILKDLGDCSDYINFRYTEYSIDCLKSDDDTLAYKSKYIKQNIIPKSCLYTLFIDTYKDKIDNCKNFKKVDLTYEFLYKIIHGDKPFDKEGLGVCLDDFCKVIEYFTLSMRCFNIFGDIVYTYEPEKKWNKVINPKTFYILVHNNHCYQINHNINMLNQIKDKITDATFYVSDTYILPKANDSEVETFEEFVETFDEITDYVYENTKINKFRFYCNNITDIFNEILGKYEPKIYVEQSQIKSFYLDNLQRNNNLISIEVKVETSKLKYNLELENSIECINEKRKQQQEIEKYVLTEQNLSSYNESVFKMFSKYKTGGIIGNLIDETNLGLMETDFNKCYPDILAKLPCLPSVNEYDDFVDYDGHKIKECDLYFVEFDSETNFKNSKYALCYGYTLKRCEDKYKIISYIQISKKNTNNVKYGIEKLFQVKFSDSDKENNQIRRDILVELCGKTGIDENEKSFTNIFTDKSEAYRYREKYDGFIYEHNFDGKTYYFLRIKKTKQIRTGFLPIYMFIIDIAQLNLYFLKKRGENCGLVPHFINTDCVRWGMDENFDINFETFKNMYPEYFDYTDKYDISSMGKLKCDYKYHKYDKPLRFKNNDNIYKSNKSKVNNIQIMDEFDEEAIYNEMDKYQHIQINASYGGCGKTQIALNYSKNRKYKTLTLADWNEIVYNISTQTDGLVLTVSSVIGYKKAKVVNICIDDYDLIIIDEIFIITINKLAKLWSLIKHKRCICTGDEFQLPPIEKLDVKDTKTYYRNAVNSMFTNSITLKEPKRIRCPKHTKSYTLGDIKHCCDCIKVRDNYKQIMDFIKYEDIKIVKKELIKNLPKVYKLSDLTTKINLSYTNSTRISVNNYLHNKINNGKFKKNMSLICKSSINIGDYRCKTNHRYTINKVISGGLTLYDGQYEFDVNNKQLEKYFTLPYCRTVHSLQGSTVYEKISIFDIEHPCVSNNWLFVAFSRCVNINDISIYVGNELQQDSSDEIYEIFNKRVQQHKIQDNKKFSNYEDMINKNKDYINADFLYEMYLKNNHCVHCGTLLNTENVSVDRINNDLPHIKGNVELSCHMCNISKH